MIDIDNLLDRYREDTTIRYENDYIFVAFPFYHLESDESIALRFSETEDDRPVITDCGTSKNYIELMDINIEDYREK